MKIVSAAEMRAIDRATTAQPGVSSLTLMENAGLAVASAALRWRPGARHILVVCGKGNNGGDGLAAARHLLAAGKEVTLWLLGAAGMLSADARAMLARLPSPPVELQTEAALSREADHYHGCDLVVDAIFGTGFRPPPEGLHAAAIGTINRLHAFRLAVDVPSGADADACALPASACVQAHAVVTFTALKPLHVFALAAVPVTVAAIGTPEEAIQSSLHMQTIDREDVLPLLQSRPRAANKGTFGHVAIIGGSVGKTGAVIMAAMAALRVGAGLVTVACPRSLLSIVAGAHPELMTMPLHEDEQGAISVLALEQVRGLMEGKGVAALGPGLSRDGEAAQFARAFFDRGEGPLVLDADGLNAFAGHVQDLHGERRALVLTPHPGELARLTGATVAEIQSDRVAAARSLAQAQHAHVVLKGAQTVVAHPDGEIWINPTGNPGMATGGTGDILTGMIAGLIAQFPNDLPRCVRGAVYLHGQAGDLAAAEFGEMSMIATDLITYLPEAILALQRPGP